MGPRDPKAWRGKTTGRKDEDATTHPEATKKCDATLGL